MRAVLTVASMLLAIASPAAAEIVRTDSGPVRGKLFEGGGHVFRGIPFAAPPVEGLRWKPPQPPASWKGVRDATGDPASCLQSDYGWNRGSYLRGREDCLTLDVRTPSLAGKRPVLVWIHGGGNYAGSPDDIVLSDVGKEVVLVGIRYRLGIFGFLSHRKLTDEQGASGNYGLMDQIAALQWVQRNIRRFGGDPDNVTIAGESAGSQDVGLMLAAPAARQLFHKAIMESGTPGFGLPFRSLEEGHRIGDQADSLLGTGGDVAKLRAASVPALLDLDKRLHDDAVETDDYKWLRTTIDGKVLPASPRELIAQGPAKPLIVGSNRFELDLPGGRPHRDAFVARAFGANEGRARAFYRLDRPDPPADPRLGTRDQQIATDVTFRCPAIAMARLVSAKDAPVWHYEFDVGPNGGMTRHALEIGYAFGNDRFAGGLSLKPYWLNFIRSGDPNGPSLPAWPRFDGTAQRHVLFSDSGVAVRGPLRPEICSLLDRL